MPKVPSKCGCMCDVMIVWVVSNPYHSMAIPWVVSMNIASEKKCVSQCYKVGEGSIPVSMYFCVFFRRVFLFPPRWVRWERLGELR